MKEESYEKLPKKFKNKWLKALTSGKFKKCRGKLYREQKDSFCCLGVACVISGYAKSSLVDDDFIDTNKTKVVAALRLNEDTQDKLAQINDRSTSFEPVAKWISKNL